MKKKLLSFLLICSFMIVDTTIFASTEPSSLTFLPIRGKAFTLYKEAQSGSLHALNELKQEANKGNHWAAMQYGYLAQTGQMPDKKNVKDYALALKAYNLATKKINKYGENLGYFNNYLAAYNTGLIYYYGGNGIKANGAEALRWFKIALNYDNANDSYFFAPAAVMIARIYEAGYGVKQNRFEAENYWAMAARDRLSTALYNYGRFLYYGVGKQQNMIKGMQLFQQAANRNEINAVLMMYRINAQGNEFIKPQPQEAAMWLLIAANIDRQYQAVAEQVLNRFKESERINIRNKALLWISARNGETADFDFKKPLNQFPMELNNF